MGSAPAADTDASSTTEPVTNSAAITDTPTITATGAMTGTDAMTGTEDMTGTEEMSGTSEMTSTTVTTATTQAATGDERVINVIARSMDFVPGTDEPIQVKAGEGVRFVVTSPDMYHTFTVATDESKANVLFNLEVFPGVTQPRSLGLSMSQVNITSTAFLMKH